MRAIVVTCPQCGARLRTDGTLVQVVCEYCGTASRLQRRTAVLERVMPPPAAPNLPQPVALQRRTFVLPILFIVGALVVSGAVTAIAAYRRQATHRAAQQAPTTSTPAPATHTQKPTAPPPLPAWEARDALLLADLDGDGTVEIFGRGREGDNVVLVAIDLDGKLRWKSKPLGTYDATYRAPVALAKNMLLFASMGGEVRAFAIANGASAWTAKLDERTHTFCDGDSIVIAIGADDVRRGLHLADGAVASLPAERKATCRPLPTDQPEHVPNSSTRAFAEKQGIQSFAHTVNEAPGGGRLLAGTRNKGTAVPTLVALDAGGRQRWRIEVPLDPLGARTEPPGKVVVGEDVVCAVYHAQSSTEPLDLTCLSLAEGKRLWTERLDSHYASTLVMTNGTLLVSMWGNLEARDLKTGAVRWQFTPRAAK